MTILHITKRFWPFEGGVERYVGDLGAAQAAQGHRVRVLTIDRDLMGSVAGSLPPREEYRSIDVLRVPAVGTPRKQFPVGRYGLIIQALRNADVVHHHDPRFLFETAIAVRRLAGRPLIFHTHGLIWHTPQYSRLKQLAMRCYYGPLLRTCVDAIVADSVADAVLLADTGNVRGPRVHVIRNAVDVTRFSRITRRPERGLILVFGRLDTHKGLDQLLSLLGQVPGDWRLIIAGTGPADMRSGLEALASAAGISGRIAWAGRVPDADLDQLLARAWLAVFPSRFEGFGLALLEALAAGVPVLASSLPTHREILGPELASRITVFDDTPQAASAVVDALTCSVGEAARLSRVGRSRAAQFSQGDLSDGITTLYDELGIRPRLAERA